MRRAIPYIALSLLVLSCSGMEKSEKERIRKANEKKEKIYRSQETKLLHPIQPKHHTRDKYPWEQGNSINYLRITKEHFRCKGSELNPPKQRPAKQPALRDCGGIAKHGLPYRDGKEFIYPIFINILNYLQETLEAKVVITSGHRCPQHNTYINPTKKNQTSKHQIGAEVDIYLEGYEQDPLKVISTIMEYYQTQPQEYQHFHKATKNPRDLKNLGWYNKELIIRLYEKDEGRDQDNRHPYPYINLELKYDREQNEVVQYNWNRATYGYTRH